MYVNKISVAASDVEGFIRFDFIGPEVKEDGTVEKVIVFESQQVAMSKDMLKKLRDLINDVIEPKNDQESV